MSRLRDCHCLNLLFLCFLSLLFPLDTCFLPFRLFLDPSFLALLLWAATDGSTILMTQNITIFFLDFKNIFRFPTLAYIPRYPPWTLSCWPCWHFWPTLPEQSTSENTVLLASSVTSCRSVRLWITSGRMRRPPPVNKSPCSNIETTWRLMTSDLVPFSICNWCSATLNVQPKGVFGTNPP